MKARPFDLILLDIVMPVMDGHEVLRVMQADEVLRSIPVIVISASAEVADAILCIQNGAEDYLPKPFDPVLLRARIGSSLAKKRLNDAVRKHMEFIRDILGKFVPDTVVNQIVESEWRFETIAYTCDGDDDRRGGLHEHCREPPAGTGARNAE